MQLSKFKEFYPIVLIMVFLGLLLIPLRTLSFDAHDFESSFYPRSRLIALNANLHLLLGDHVFPKVLVGERRWLVFTGENDLDDYQKTRSFTEAELAQFQQNLDALSTLYAERGITLLVIVPPNKNTIYPEQVPGEIHVSGRASMLDQVTTFLREHGHTQIIDLRSALMVEKSKHQVYYSTDTHWNGYGAYLAYSALMNEISKSYPQLKAHPIIDFKVKAGQPEILDLSRNMGVTLLKEPKIQLFPLYDLRANFKSIDLGARQLMFSHISDPTLPNLVLYYDSFFFTVIPLLSEHFNNGVYVQNFSGGGLWNLSWVDEREPDVVIIEFSERYLDALARFIIPNR